MSHINNVLLAEDIAVLEEELKIKEQDYEDEMETLFKTVGWLQKDRVEIDILKRKLSALKNQD